MVFQSYAIWPHMNVFENIAFPLRARRLPPAEIRDKVMTMLQSLGLEGLHDRPAPLLSGGQQQRVALGRALVGDPEVLLLDEPFSNLDARRRDEMRFELKEVQARVGVTTIFITHDQNEAMILSDRVLVMNAGRIVQEGTPEAIYQRPSTQIRHGISRPGRPGERPRRDGARRFAAGRGGRRRRHLGVPLDDSHPWQQDDEVILMLRSAAVQVRAPNGSDWWPGRILSRIYLGERTEYIVGVGHRADPRLWSDRRPARRGRRRAAGLSTRSDPRMAGGETGRGTPGRNDMRRRDALSMLGLASLGTAMTAMGLPAQRSDRIHGIVGRRRRGRQEGRGRRLVVLRRARRGDGAAGAGVRAALRHPRRACPGPHRRLRGALECRARRGQAEHRHTLLGQPGEPAPCRPRPRSIVRHAARGDRAGRALDHRSAGRREGR